MIKARYKLLVILLIVFVIAMIAVFLNTKTDYKVEVDNYGQLKVEDEYNMDNSFEVGYYYTSPKDVKIEFIFNILKGSLDASVKDDNGVIYNRKYFEGDNDNIQNFNQIDSKKLIINVNTSSDIEGLYSIKIYTREKRWRKLFDILKVVQ